MPSHRPSTARAATVLVLIMALLVTGTPAGAVLAEPGWEAAADRYVVYARASIGNLRVRAG